MENELNLTIGRWTVQRDGISSNPTQLLTGFADKGFIWSKMQLKDNWVWDLPIHLARKTWMTSLDMEHLLEAMAIYRRLYPIPHDIIDINEVDIRTAWIALALIENKDNEQ